MADLQCYELAECLYYKQLYVASCSFIEKGICTPQKAGDMTALGRAAGYTMKKKKGPAHCQALQKCCNVSVT